MAREVEVEIPVIVTVTIPDGYDLSNEDIAEVAYDTINQQCSICIEERDGQPVAWASCWSICIEERDGQPVAWASCWSEVLTDETKVNGEYLQTPAAGLE